MALVQLYSSPQDPDFLDVWSFANFDSHNQIRSALLAKGVNLPTPPLWPISRDDFQGFELRHQEVHNAIDAALGQDSQDYTNFDLDRPDVVAQVLYLHAEDHRKAHEKLGI